MKRVTIGCGAGFAGDRFDACLPVIEALAEHDGPRYLMFEVLAERTLALAQQHRQKDPALGYSPYLDHYISRALGPALSADVRIVSNMGAANPVAAAHRVQDLARGFGFAVPRIAVVLGDDLTSIMSEDEIRRAPSMEGTDLAQRPLIAANAYLGAKSVAAALATGAEIVLVGRTTDSALALGPLIHEFGWGPEAWDHLAAGVVAGHLLECGAQVTGAYFADPGFKDVPDLARVGFPIANVSEEGSIVITKPPGTGGCVTKATVTEQLLYEMHDPAAYLTPDVTADITEVTLSEEASDRIKIAGVRGHPAPETLKATICVENGWMGEAEISYAGPNALARARLAGEVVAERLAMHGVNQRPRVEIIGAGSVLTGGVATDMRPDGDYRMRVAMLAETKEGAQMVADEVLSLLCSGPAAGGGVRSHVSAQMATASILVPRDRVEAQVQIVEVNP
ncbi:MAG: acyclic terpene utilization AtuA family protein [Pseudomonadota bacterium]